LIKGTTESEEALGEATEFAASNRTSTSDNGEGSVPCPWQPSRNLGCKDPREVG